MFLTFCGSFERWSLNLKGNVGTELWVACSLPRLQGQLPGCRVLHLALKLTAESAECEKALQADTQGMEAQHLILTCVAAVVLHTVPCD